MLLNKDRPPYVTILCLVRDAASRLPDGVGTRADICALLKCSQYLENKKSLDTQINNVVSGALDRLHYEADPCVKYDNEKRLWIYLHKNKKIDNEIWRSFVATDTPNTPEMNSYYPKQFFDSNSPAYESEEEIEMVREKAESSGNQQILNPYGSDGFDEKEAGNINLGPGKHLRFSDQVHNLNIQPESYKRQKLS